jgi:hypothetical protein
MLIRARFKAASVFSGSQALLLPINADYNCNFVFFSLGYLYTNCNIKEIELHWAGVIYSTPFLISDVFKTCQIP